MANHFHASAKNKKMNEFMKSPRGEVNFNEILLLIKEVYWNRFIYSSYSSVPKCSLYGHRFCICSCKKKF